MTATSIPGRVPFFTPSRRRRACLAAALPSLLLAVWLPSRAAELKPFSSDGCSLFPDGTPAEKAKWCDCCFAHDIAYWQGGTAKEREKADDALRNCVLARTGDKALAESMRLGVRAGGAPASVMWYRWGYGWPLGRGYKPLTDAEKQQASLLFTDYTKKHPGGYCAPQNSGGSSAWREKTPDLLTPSEELRAVVGEGSMSRNEIVRKLYAYIKKNGLQDKKNARLINCDQKLERLFPGEKQVSMFDIAKMIDRNVAE